MELYQQAEDINVIGIHVTTFPNGIKEAFGSLMKTLGNDRAYYGISWMDENNNVQYYAMAKEVFPDEGKQYNYELLTIEKGEYQSETLHNWMSKTDSIKDIFHNLMANNKPSNCHPCIEWYKSDEEMLCMIKTS
jgi:predicted transcriptional regulator YdeE